MRKLEPAAWSIVDHATPQQRLAIGLVRDSGAPAFPVAISVIEASGRKNVLALRRLGARQAVG